ALTLFIDNRGAVHAPLAEQSGALLDAEIGQHGLYLAGHDVAGDPGQRLALISFHFRPSAEESSLWNSHWQASCRTNKTRCRCEEVRQGGSLLRFHSFLRLLFRTDRAHRGDACVGFAHRTEMRRPTVKGLMGNSNHQAIAVTWIERPGRIASSSDR